MAHSRTVRGTLNTLWRWVNRGWGAISGLGVLISVFRKSKTWLEVWHWPSSLDTARSLSQEVGINTPIIAQMVTSPWAGLILIVAGLVGLPSALETEHGKKSLKMWPILGWSVFSLTVSVVLSVFLFGSYLETSRLSDVEEFYLDEHLHRYLSPSQVASLRKSFCALPKTLPLIKVEAVSAPEAFHYAKQFIGVLAFCRVLAPNIGGLTESIDVVEDDPDETGIFVSTKDKKNPNLYSQRLLQMLKPAKLQVGYSQYSGDGLDDPRPAIFISYK